MDAAPSSLKVGHRFRGFLPVVVDVETGGFNWQTDALLEIAAVILGIDERGDLVRKQTVFTHVEPFEGARLDPASMQVTGIRVDSPLRLALPEKEALAKIFGPIRQAVAENGCSRAILVGHNAHFDLNFVNAAIARTSFKRSPFHPFSVFDTVTLGGAALGQTVLARALEAAGLKHSQTDAHSAIYDAECTADLFCLIVNRMRPLFAELAAKLPPEPAPAETRPAKDAAAEAAAVAPGAPE